jgi:hypothetical protein
MLTQKETDEERYYIQELSSYSSRENVIGKQAGDLYVLESDGKVFGVYNSYTEAKMWRTELKAYMKIECRKRKKEMNNEVIIVKYREE